MGWNSGYSKLERQIIELYNINELTIESLNAIMDPYKGTDCDSGGSNNLHSKDGLNMAQIICKIMKPDEYEDAIKNPIYSEGYTEKCLENNEKFYNLYSSIWYDTWNMW